MNREYRMLSFVPRWGVAPRHHQASVAEHSFYVSLYSGILCDILNIQGSERLTVIEYALVHDVFETWTSDIPGPAKRAIVDPDKLDAYHREFGRGMGTYYHQAMSGKVSIVFSDDEDPKQGHLEYNARDIVKVADLIDSVFYLKSEILLGNQFVWGLYKRDVNRLEKALSVFGDHYLREIYNTVEDALLEMANMGAVLPIVDSDLPRAAE